MPYIENSLYKPPALMRSAHLLTIYPSLFRKIRDVKYERERINTPEADFLDIDWSRIGSSKVAIISHGLEGHTQRSYVLGMVRALNKHGWDVAAWNFRGCSGEPNRLPQFYHSGSSDDLETVINHIRGLGKYEKIDLVGFSMGGNITLKYLGEKSGEVPQEIGRAVAFSVPCDLKNSSYKLDKLGNALYMRRFLRSLRVKIRQKAALFPDKLNDDGYRKIKNFKHFDDRYTAKLHGFRDAEDYWQQCSSLFYLKEIRIPALLVSARDDPFLSLECYPYKIANRHEYFFLETPKHGGHVGFVQFNSSGIYWSEQRAIQFLNHY